MTAPLEYASKATKWELGGPSPGILAQNFILAELILRKTIDSTKTQPQHIGVAAILA